MRRLLIAISIFIFVIIAILIFMKPARIQDEPDVTTTQQTDNI